MECDRRSTNDVDPPRERHPAATAAAPTPARNSRRLIGLCIDVVPRIMHKGRGTRGSAAERRRSVKLSTQLLWSAAVAALGGFLFGFDTAVISGATDALRLRFALTSGQLGFTVASALIGTIVGSVAAGAPSEQYGRRPVLRALAVLYFVSAVGCGFAPNWISLLMFRFIGGLAIGASSVVAPMYIAEISPAAVRGRLVALSQFNVVAGILAAYFSNYIIATILGGAATSAWRGVVGVAAGAPPLLFLVL